MFGNLKMFHYLWCSGIPPSHGWLLNPWNVASVGKELAFNTFSNLDFFKVRYSRVASGHPIGQCGSRVIHSVSAPDEWGHFFFGHLSHSPWRHRPPRCGCAGWHRLVLGIILLLSLFFINDYLGLGSTFSSPLSRTLLCYSYHVGKSVHSKGSLWIVYEFPFTGILDPNNSRAMMGLPFQC